MSSALQRNNKKQIEWRSACIIFYTLIKIGFIKIMASKEIKDMHHMKLGSVV